MFGSAILDVAAGLIFIYFVMSIVCTQINEMLSSVFMWRAQDLEKGIRAMLEHAPIEGRTRLDKDLLAHPLITALGKKPSYIPSRTFALALLDNFAPEAGQPKTFDALR